MLQRRGMLVMLMRLRMQVRPQGGPAIEMMRSQPGPVVEVGQPQM